MTIVTPNVHSEHLAPGCNYHPTGNTHSVFSLKPTAVVPCALAVTSPHLTMMNTTLTDVDITPTLLENLTEFDVLHIALGCTSALDIFHISQQLSLHLIISQFLMLQTSPTVYTWMLHMSVDRRVGQLTWTTLVEKDSHSKVSLCMGGTRDTVSIQDMLTFCTAHFEGLQYPSTTHPTLWSQSSKSHPSALVCFQHRSPSACSFSP